MKKHKSKDGIDKFIGNKELSDEAIYAAYDFLLQTLMQFEMKASYKLRRYMKEQEEIHSNLCANQEDNPPV